MISLLLFFLAIFISGIVVRVGAVALELTGLPEEQASFQALSAFSGVGYTTKEAEFILSHPQRRKIIGKLIDIGSAGVITLIGTVGGIIFTSNNIMNNLKADAIAPWLPLNPSQLVLLIIVLVFYAAHKVTHTPSTSRLLKEVVATFLLKSEVVNPASFEEVLAAGNGYGIYQIEITQNNPLTGKTIGESRLKEYDTEILFASRKSETLNRPSDAFRLEEGDVVTVLGPVAEIYDHCCDLKTMKEKKLTKKEIQDAPLALLEKAPAFSLKDQQGKEVRLADYSGRQNIVLVFYPKDKSMMCSLQLKAFNDALEIVRSLNAEVIGINNESTKSHARFCDSSSLSFPLLSDTTRKACKTYKALMLGGLLVNRTVYVIDKEGTIRYAKRGRPPVHEILGVLRGLADQIPQAISR